MPEGPILACLPIPYGENGGFWYRDCGLIVATLRQLGYEAKLVCLQGTEPQTVKRPLLLGSPAELESPAWWQAHQPSAVICNFWGAYRYTHMRTAVLAATTNTLEIADSDGLLSPRFWPSQFLRNVLTQRLDANPNGNFALAVLYAAIRTSVLAAFPRLSDQRTAREMARMPMAAQSPVAAGRIKRFLEDNQQDSSRVFFQPHAVDLTDFPEQACQRENTIVSIGRWDTAQKNVEALIRALSITLGRHPNWNAKIIGEISHRKRGQLKALPADLAARIELVGKVPHEKLNPYLRGAKIFLMSSRHESFNISAAEALCCGCSIAGPSNVPSVTLFTAGCSGTAASRGTGPDLADALDSEIQAWTNGERHARDIEGYWTKKFSATEVCTGLAEKLKLTRSLPLA